MTFLVRRFQVTRLPFVAGCPTSLLRERPPVKGPSEAEQRRLAKDARDRKLFDL